MSIRLSKLNACLKMSVSLFVFAGALSTPSYGGGVMSRGMVIQEEIDPVDQGRALSRLVEIENEELDNEEEMPTESTSVVQNDDLFSQLPKEAREVVLLNLDALSVTRVQSVCRMWNKIVCDRIHYLQSSWMNPRFNRLQYLRALDFHPKTMHFLIKNLDPSVEQPEAMENLATRFRNEPLFLKSLRRTLPDFDHEETLDWFFENSMKQKLPQNIQQYLVALNLLQLSGDKKSKKN